MVLPEIVVEIEKLREKIVHQWSKLRHNETATRDTLIGPLLDALGWNTRDLNQVYPNYPIGKNKADYVLLNSNKICVVVEAKAIDTPLDSAALSQALGYAFDTKAPFYVVTNGARWELHDTSKNTFQTKVCEWDLNSTDSLKTAREACALQRFAILKALSVPTTAPTRSGTSFSATPPSGPAVSSTSKSLLDLHPRSGEKPPAQIMFPDKTTETINTWNDILVKVAEWLIKNGHFAALSVPLMNGPVRYLVANTNHHPDAKSTPFHFGVKLSNGLYLEAHMQTLPKVKKTVFLIQQCGQNPSKFLIS